MPRGPWHMHYRNAIYFKASIQNSTVSKFGFTISKSKIGMLRCKWGLGLMAQKEKQLLKRHAFCLSLSQCLSTLKLLVKYHQGKTGTCAIHKTFLPVWHYEELLRKDDNLESVFVGGASLMFLFCDTSSLHAKAWQGVLSGMVRCRWGLGPMAQKKKQLVAEGKLDKHGRPNENTPKEYLRSLPDIPAKVSHFSSQQWHDNPSQGVR